MTRLRPRLLAAVATGGLVAALATVPAAPSQAAVSGLVRVDQGGYLPGETKQAYLMTTGAASGVRYAVVDSAGATVLSGSVGGTSRGSWNSSYPDVYPIAFSGLTAPGTYRLKVSGGVSATSPPFTVGDAAGVYGKLVADGVSFFQLQRDGRDVIPGPLGRKASHLHDSSASVYATPHFQSGGDTITDSDLKKTGGPVDVEGGWFDAGDYLKFTHTTAYGDALLFAAERTLGGRSPSTLDAEAHFGEAWLAKMWNQQTKTLYLQVGIGSGNSAGSFTGDHDLWRLPEKDDGDGSSADRYAAAHRPVFQAAAAGAKVSPNLAGRVSAAFALAAQVDAAADPTRAAAEYQAGASLYAQAATSSPPNPLVTALPNEFYPEDTWHDDMELGATEIALATSRLGLRGSARYLREAAGFARGYLAGETGDTFNLYDVSALAHADLIAVIRRAGNPAGLAVTPARLAADLRRQLRTGADRAAADVFHAGGVYTDFDVDSHTFGLLATAAMYRGTTGDTRFDQFATEQRDWVLGANAWGTSFMIGEGSTFPHCPQHVIANLRGSVDGSPPVLTGAVVNGPNDPGLFTDGLGDYLDGMVVCPHGGADPYATFSGHGSRYVDDVRAWQTDEPALDMTGSAVVAAALQVSVRPI
jgi:endoglucanase